jgi:GT2 family glycosyltransferase
MSSMTLAGSAESKTNAVLGDVRIGLEGEIVGYAVDPIDLGRRLVVELRIDGEPIAVAISDRFEPTLLDRRLGDGCYGFMFPAPRIGEGVARATVVLANSDCEVGRSLLVQSRRRETDQASRPSDARWVGGLRFAGWIRPQAPERAEEIEAIVEGECVARVKADRWTPFGDGSLHGAAQLFNLSLPRRFADGRVRKAHIRVVEGEELAASPCDFVAFEDGLADFLEQRCAAPSEILRGRLFDKLMPQAIPFEEFAAWRARYPQNPPPTPPKGLIAVALIGDQRFEECLASLEAQEGCDWVAGCLADVGAGIAFERDALEQFIATQAAGCETVILAKSGTVFEPNALTHLASALEQSPQASIAYSDLILQSADGSLWPLAWPAFDYERAMEQGYAARVFAVRCSRLAEALATGAHDLFRIFNCCLDRPNGGRPGNGDGAPVHVPNFLATISADEGAGEAPWLAEAAREHFEARGLEVRVAASPRASWPAVRVRRAIADKTLSVVIDARSLRVDMEVCLNSIDKAAKGVEYEVFLVGNDADLVEFDYLRDNVRRVHMRGRASLERCANSVMTAASGDYLFLLDAAFGDFTEDDMRELMSRLEEPDAAAVGPLLINASGGVSGAAQVLGVGFAAAVAVEFATGRAAAYRDDLAVAGEASALVAVGMMTRRDLFRSLSGFDVDRFGDFAVTDYGLRARERGLRLIATPHARLSRPSSAPRRGLPRAEDERERDLRNLRARWGEALLDDPYYNPCLSLDLPFSGLAWPPRSRQPRRPVQGRPRATPPGF